MKEDKLTRCSEKKVAGKRVLERKKDSRLREAGAEVRMGLSGTQTKSNVQFEG